MSRKELVKRGGRGLLVKYGSIPEVIKAVYPDQTWDTERFEDSKSVGGSYKDVKNQRKLLDRIGDSLSIKQVRIIKCKCLICKNFFSSFSTSLAF